MCYELAFLLKEAGDPEPKVDRTGIRGLVVAKTALDPLETVEKFNDVSEREALRVPLLASNNSYPESCPHRLGRGKDGSFGARLEAGRGRDFPRDR